MRILLLTPSLRDRAEERLAVVYAAGMRRRGHEVTIAFGGRAELAESARSAGIDLVRLSDVALGTRVLARRALELREVASAFEPQVVHAQSIGTALGAAAVLPSVPCLLTFNGAPEHIPLAGAALHAAGVRVTAASEATAQMIGRIRFMPPVELLFTGVDLGALDASSEKLGAGQRASASPCYACVVDDALPSCVEHTLAGIGSAVAEQPGSSVLLIGDSASRERYGLLSEALGLSVHGGEAAPAGLTAADVVVFPEQRARLPLALLEAFALRRPVVAVAQTGTLTPLRDGETGWLVPAGDERALAAALIEAASNPEEVRRRGSRARAIVASTYSQEAMLTRLDSLLCSSATGAKPGLLTMKPSEYYALKHTWQTLRTSRLRRSPAPRPWHGVRVLGYHRVAQDGDELAINPMTFRAQMELVVASGATPIDLVEALEILSAPVEEQFVCVTFDDGYADNFAHAYPTLRELGIPATTFVVPAAVDGVARLYWYKREPQLATWSDLYDLATDDLFTIGAHTRTHPALPALDDEPARDEIVGSKLDIESRLQRPVHAFCYPAGLFGPREVDLVRGAGYRIGVTCEPGVNRATSDPAVLRRTMIERRDSLGDFELKLGGLLDSSPLGRDWVRKRRGGSRG
jgi:peptidoglycan/xylan/chitin deacetylase (PgdA/CDA1 family)